MKCEIWLKCLGIPRSLTPNFKMRHQRQQLVLGLPFGKTPKWCKIGVTEILDDAVVSFTHLLFCVHLLFSLFSMGSGISHLWFPTRPTIRLAVPFVEQKQSDKSCSLFSVWFTSSITVNCEILSNIIISSFQWLHVHLYVTEFHC